MGKTPRRLSGDQLLNCVTDEGYGEQAPHVNSAFPLTSSPSKVSPPPLSSSSSSGIHAAVPAAPAPSSSLHTPLPSADQPSPSGPRGRDRRDSGSSWYASTRLSDDTEDVDDRKQHDHGSTSSDDDGVAANPAMSRATTDSSSVVTSVPADEAWSHAPDSLMAGAVGGHPRGGGGESAGSGQPHGDWGAIGERSISEPLDAQAADDELSRGRVTPLQDEGAAGPLSGSALTTTPPPSTTVTTTTTSTSTNTDISGLTIVHGLDTNTTLPTDTTASDSTPERTGTTNTPRAIRIDVSPAPTASSAAAATSSPLPASSSSSLLSSLSAALSSASSSSSSSSSSSTLPPAPLLSPTSPSTPRGGDISLPSPHSLRVPTPRAKPHSPSSPASSPASLPSGSGSGSGSGFGSSPSSPRNHTQSYAAPNPHHHHPHAHGASFRDRAQTSPVHQRESISLVPKIDRWGVVRHVSVSEADPVPPKAALDKKAIKHLRRDTERERKWVEMWAKWGSGHSVRVKQPAVLKRRIRKGIPDSLRANMWVQLAGSDKLPQLSKGVFADLLQRRSHYEPLLHKDIGRTFPLHVMFTLPPTTPTSTPPATPSSLTLTGAGRGGDLPGTLLLAPSASSAPAAAPAAVDGATGVPPESDSEQSVSVSSVFSEEVRSTASPAAAASPQPQVRAISLTLPQSQPHVDREGEGETSHSDDGRLRAQQQQQQQNEEKQLDTERKQSLTSSNRLFTSAGLERLYRVVKAYSLYDESLGYCQGLCFVTGVLLMYMGEELAFWTLERILAGPKYHLRALYTDGLPLLHQFFYQLDKLTLWHRPRLHAQLAAKGIRPNLYATQWFLTLYSHDFPIELVIRVFDIFLSEGKKILFRVALYLLQSKEAELLALDDADADESMAVVQRIHLDPLVRDVDKVIAGALRIKLSNKQLLRLEKEYQQQRVDPEPPKPHAGRYTD